MRASKTDIQVDGRNIIVSRIIEAAPSKVFAAWTVPELVKQWFAPLPWTVSEVKMDVRPGGTSIIVMRSPDGTEFPTEGVFLDVVLDELLVFTNAYTSAWEPSAKPFMTGVLTLSATADGHTNYKVTVKHWSMEDRETHEKMNFHDGWIKCTEQLAALVENRTGNSLLYDVKPPQD